MWLVYLASATSVCNCHDQLDIMATSISSTATTVTIGSGTMEGTLSKWTNVMKGWQYRFFVLDENAGLLSYYTVCLPSYFLFILFIHYIMHPSPSFSLIYFVISTNDKYFKSSLITII